jgi:ribose transport system ATP-binding protein
MMPPGGFTGERPEGFDGRGNGEFDEASTEFYMNDMVNSFSGGNQQKVLMAKWLAADVDVLILDEPTRGVDVGAKQTIHNVVRKLADQGKSVILLSSDLPEVVSLCDRAVILREGHLIGEMPKAAINENSLLLAANGKGEYVNV